MRSDPAPVRRTGRALKLALAGTAALTSTLALVGCRGLDYPTAVALSDPEKRHAISYASRVEALYIEVPRGAEGLSRNQEADVHRFLERYKQESSGKLRISAPGGVRGHLNASRSVRQVEDMVRDAGIPDKALEAVRHPTGAEPLLRLAYQRPVATPPTCGVYTEDLGDNRERIPHENFGCATQRNLALTVANARDLQEPQEETPRSSERRAVTWTKYIDAAPNAGGGGNDGGAAKKAAPAAATKQ